MIRAARAVLLAATLAGIASIAVLVSRARPPVEDGSRPAASRLAEGLRYSTVLADGTEVKAALDSLRRSSRKLGPFRLRPLHSLEGRGGVLEVRFPSATAEPPEAPQRRSDLGSLAAAFGEIADRARSTLFRGASAFEVSPCRLELARGEVVRAISAARCLTTQDAAIRFEQVQAKGPFGILELERLEYRPAASEPLRAAGKASLLGRLPRAIPLGSDVALRLLDNWLRPLGRRPT